MGRCRTIRNQGGSRFKRERRHKLAEAQNWRCAYCGCVMDFGTVTIEHVVPLGRGGTHDEMNMVAACWTCNDVRNPSRLLRGANL